jgi:AraC-like DNA-binding protein
MNIEQQFLFFFSALGAFNGLLLGCYFFFAQPKRTANQFLGVLLLVMSIRIWKSVFFYFNPELSKVFLQVGLSACFLIGPFLYFYLCEMVKVQHHKRSWKPHLALLFAIIIGVGIRYPYQDYPEYWGTIFVIISYQWLVYLVISGITIRAVFAKIFKSRLTQDEIWMLSVFGGNCLIWFAYYTASYTSYIVGALSFSFVFYLLVLQLFFHKKNAQLDKPQKYVDKKIDDNQAQALLAQLLELMAHEKLYQDANLTMPMVAKKMNILTQRLSQLLNDNLQKSFPVFVNEYRIKQAQALLSGDKAMKMDTIADECGFNSNSTFYAAFKKVTGTTPAKFRGANI